MFADGVSGGNDCNGQNGHDSRGRFAPGNPGNPNARGRPRRVTERDYLVVLTEECTPEEWRLICRRAKADALAGDPRAREWLSRYLLGNPAELPALGAVTANPEDRT
jgi:hypothetical protein